ncbi:unnamed protein product [Moneuplotes crassus]|uniref:non-specific serine/threonine protein kinase n=1 Tax=Euplotes crassus TaxID=5936 RepID=A0AAD1TZP6_EUPCR|nr:unnamed protein product [Moneuplotes crassus]
MSLKDFEVLKTIGEGSYSKVYKVKRISDNEIYALKKVKINGLKEKEKRNAFNEVRILASINHPNIIAYKEAFFDEALNTLNIVMEFADDGDLEEKIKQKTKSGDQFEEKEIWKIFVQCLKGLKCLHAAKVLHRDLKCANVFMCKDGTVKLGDLNVSKVAKNGMVNTQTGTPYYASPEVWKDKPYDDRSDIWSLGCVMYEIATLKPPFRAKDMKSLYMKVIRGYYPSVPTRYSTDLAEVIQKCLKTSPVKRATAHSLMESDEIQEHKKELDQDSQIIDHIPATLNLLSTIKLPRKLLDIKKRLPKSNYCTPVISRKKLNDIKIAKGLPEIFDTSFSRLSSKRPKPSEAYDCISNSQHPKSIEPPKTMIPSARNRIYKRMMNQNRIKDVGNDCTDKIRLPRIQRGNPKNQHHGSVNYSYRSLSTEKRGVYPYS